MVGDRLSTDIRFGLDGGISTLLVMTGVTSERDLKDPTNASLLPHYYTSSLADLLVCAPATTSAGDLSH